MKLIYTKHAEEMLVFRRIKKGQVRECTQNPDQIVPIREGKTAYLKDFGKNFLKLIVVEEGVNIIIITLYWIAKRRIKK